MNGLRRIVSKISYKVGQGQRFEGHGQKQKPDNKASNYDVDR